jgi:hypothetical protein
MEKKIFAEGLRVFKPHSNAPVFILHDLSIHASTFMDWLSKQAVNDKGYIKLQICLSKTGKHYATLNTYQPTMQNDTDYAVNQDTGKQVEENQDTGNQEDFPF